MKIELSFRLYMMRYGIALLASSFANPNRITFSEDICKRLTTFLTEKRKIPENNLASFEEYLFNKPGSPRYTPIRQALKKGQHLEVERQDLLLSDLKLPSSVGALTQDYFDDALSLAHILKLVKKDQNLLLTRGRLSLSTDWTSGDPFHLRRIDALYLGLWFLDADCDWLWAFLLQIPQNSDFEITVDNRVDLLLQSWECILSARQLRSGHPKNVHIRTRLNELMKITKRNVREKLNLGQPWSWFLIPRLELLVDAGILRKRERHGLTGYSLTHVGQKMRCICDSNRSGEVLIHNYFGCHDSDERPVADGIEWKYIDEKLNIVARELKTSVGYFPIFETASAVCVSQLLDPVGSDRKLWEITGIKERLWEESRSDSPNVRLAIDRYGKIYAFKIEENKSEDKTQ